jgi:hypothetical protein
MVAPAATTPAAGKLLGLARGSMWGFVGRTVGYQAMIEAQRFPWDFDGIIAGAPDMDESDLAVRGIWAKRSFLGDDETNSE